MELPLSRHIYTNTRTTVANHMIINFAQFLLAGVSKESPEYLQAELSLALSWNQTEDIIFWYPRSQITLSYMCPKIICSFLHMSTAADRPARLVSKLVRRQSLSLFINSGESLGSSWLPCFMYLLGLNQALTST